MDQDHLPAKLAKRGSTIVVPLVVLAGIAAIGAGSFYTVNQNEVGAVTRFGQLVSAAPVSPGLHFKLPIADTAHTIRTSIERISVPEMRVKTIDNQFVSVDLSLTYRTADPFKALFQVGDMGSGSINDKLIPFVQSRTLDVFGQVNALEITDKKKQLESNILTAVQTPAIDLFGERIEDVQITNLHYDENFERNIQQTVQTRNQQLSAANLLKVRETEAQQAVATAKGQADSAAAIAEGQKRVAIAQAEADAQRVRLRADADAYEVQKRSEAEANAKTIVGNAEAAIIVAKVKATGSADAYAEILRADAAKNWNGSVPSIQMGAGANAAQPVMVLPPIGQKP
ncbi:SPFH domain-containing protein [Methylovirgula sp. 4M-Z18]|uniref:SPFH domain-containing protein n=1 Tax=Methylovirgula sp. 4M-Z18 TaxID=2293567 RepID=UPI00131418E3|nr:SPFH domain-containing protein [Methylovirgula sp. 4M-Z18]